MTYFELLNIDQKYNIDLTRLKKSYLSLQAKYHPDRAKSSDEKSKFLDKSMQINQAYKILKDDYLRAEYLLEINGQKFDDTILKNILSTDELEQIMQQYEFVEEIEDLESLQKLKKQQLEKKAIIISKLDNAFNQNNLEQALDLTVRLKYLTNLVRNIELKIKHANS